MKHLWVDANVLLRFITKDPPALAERSARLMAKAERGEVSLYVAPLVLAEVIWADVKEGIDGAPLVLAVLRIVGLGIIGIDAAAAYW